MKSLSLSIGGVLLVANLAILILLTDCTDIVTIITSVVILTTSLFIFTSSVLPIKNGFKVSLPFLFVFMGVVEYILSFFVSSETIKNDTFLVSIILLFLFQLICLILVKTFSNHG